MHRVFSTELLLNDVLNALRVSTRDVAEVFILEHVVVFLQRFFVDVLKYIIVLRDGANDEHLSGNALVELEALKSLLESHGLHGSDGALGIMSGAISFVGIRAARFFVHRTVLSLAH